MANPGSFERKPMTLESLRRIWLIMWRQSFGFVVVVLVFPHLVELRFQPAQ